MGGAVNYDVPPHESTHVSGASDPFLSSDVLEAIIKRLQESSGPTTLAMGAVADGQYLKRNGSTVIGGTITSRSFPKRWLSGCLYSWASTTTVNISSGDWRDSADAADVTGFPACTVDCTVAGALGTDQFVIAQTASAAGTAITASADIKGNFNSPTTLTGTWTVTSTTATGSGTKALSEVAVNDLIGNSSKGWSRVASIASDTSVTLVAALPGGNAAAGSTLTRYDSPTIWIGATTSNKRMISTLSAAGTAIVVEGNTLGASIPAGTSLTVGVTPTTNGGVTLPFWLHVWVCSGGSGTTAIFSTQRNTPYPVSGYSTSVRRIGAIPTAGQPAPVLAALFQREVSSFMREAVFEDSSSNIGATILSAGTATTWTALDCKSVIPPQGVAGLFNFYMTGATPTASYNLSIRARGKGSAALLRPMAYPFVNASGMGSSCFWWPVDTAQGIDYVLNPSPSPSSTSIIVGGFREMI